MPNPHPIQTPALKAKQFKRQDNTTEPLADKVVAVRLPVRAYRLVRAMPKRGAWLRRVIVEALEREFDLLMKIDEQE
ncbi:hypothetical protein [Synechococcus sp. PCC 6312]|uniref:hypothetical protein n=1 Tax=Synechococcus sp. (strain ATCC 27167 / PCC 6312) TaxID=195253 RepID=UPI00029F38C7|nr:hypothetical protein [Synechococcus sp. PCC 6312]AFY61173.1 hypothetical protein Syn6312_2042 [Synechococcus sp. PCC 6312]